MFNKSSKSSKGKNANGEKPRNSSRGMAWQIPVFFGVIFALSVAELIFTIDTFVYLEKTDKWWSVTEKARMAFLIFSSARSILLSATYVAVNFIPMKNIMSTLHVIFLVFSTIFWVVSGVLIHQMWGYMECANSGLPSSLSDFSSQVESGMSLCHEIKTIEIIAWCIAAVSILATIPVVKTWMDRRKAKRQAKTQEVREKVESHV